MKWLKLVTAAAFLAAFAAVGIGEEKKMTPLDVKMKGIDGKDVDLSQFKGKVVLIVNVASNCGFTKQYEGLQDLYAKYEKDGLVVLGVPSNDFGMQEPGTDDEIQKFCSSKYKVTFPMTTKVPVVGKDKAELYKILTEATPADGKVKEVGWNFEKFLISREGKVVGRFESKIAPESEKLQTAIKTELEKGK